MKYLLFNLLLITSIITAAEPIIKYGIINANETWSGEINLIGDVVVSANTTLTIEPGTILKFTNYDINNLGEDPNYTEIIVLGTLISNSPTENPIIIESQQATAIKTLNVNNTNTVIQFEPYNVDTTQMRKEFKSFKNQYFIFWAVTYLMWVIRGG